MMQQEYCCQCGKPRSYTSGKRCRDCYRANAKNRRDGSLDAQVLDALLHLERHGEVICTPGEYWVITDAGIRRASVQSTTSQESK